MKYLLLVLLLVSPVAAQTIGGPHKPVNQIGGRTPPKDLEGARPRGASMPSVTPVKRLVQKSTILVPHPTAPPRPPLVNRGIAQPKAKAP
jgi:hypothetical protein